MTRRFPLALLGAGVLLTMIAGPASAQVAGGVAPPDPASAPIYDPPGYYGMAWGVPSFGVPRAYSNFASPFGGVGYGYGYSPYALLPGPYGGALWRPGFIEPGYFYAQGAYSTYPIPRGAVTPPPGVPVGYYAPALGPPMFFRP
ncbi:hypothetical protein [Tautonia plasticadhaerens]|uniref:Uncharacterized protein n=1 Tax=Tautonia plasticadhaerens TaxID=2527974 RepID=A0A518GVQ3_9BACT|nr:hypothetical protein [Tautonia plasticadhaerens]QDV32631.1 hypothetical protein ElP_04660 [Tautonia plasticadhaerens]